MAPVVLLILMAAAFCSLAMLISMAFGARAKATKAKSDSYECGIAPQGGASRRIPVQFYLTGILFIIFDIEIIFLYPFAIAYRDFLDQGLALPMLIGMGIFLGLFAIGLYWEIKSQALKWN